MFLAPRSIYSFEALIAVDGDYFISDDMLTLYNFISQQKEGFENDDKNVNMKLSVSFMGINDKKSVNLGNIISDGYIFEYVNNKPL